MFVHFLICFLESGMEKLAIMPLLSTVIKNVGFRETLGLSLGDPVALVTFLRQPELCPSPVQRSTPRLTQQLSLECHGLHTALTPATPKYIGAALDVHDFLSIFEE